MKKVIRLTEADLYRIVKRVIKEGQPFKIGTENFGPGEMVGKTINLYDDAGKTVWDQTWYIVDYKPENYNKVIKFNLNKDIDKTGKAKTAETGVMAYDCNKPDLFMVSYDYKGADTNITNQARYNPDVTNKLKAEYCPSVLNVPAEKADFAANQKTKQNANFA